MRTDNQNHISLQNISKHTIIVIQRAMTQDETLESLLTNDLANTINSVKKLNGAQQAIVANYYTEEDWEAFL